MGSIYQSIEILSKEKGIDAQVVVDAVKDAMLVAARKHYKTTEDLVADLDEKGGIQIYAVKRVVDQVVDPVREISVADARKVSPAALPDTELRIPKPTAALGRISAQTAKQVILQKVREAERETIYAEYAHRVGELVNCSIKRVEDQDLVVDLGKTEARLPKKEQSRLESYSVGERVRCVIKMVDKLGRYSGVLVSRAAPELVMRLFEQEVPEIYDNTVIIKGCAREAGERTKIAVFSRDRDVDCVGACVGMKGMRVQSIIRELRGEKIDIIEFSDDPVTYATHALSPAKISRVAIVTPGEKHMEVIVDDSQLSLAIGKKGQNVRLAAKLLGWKIDIKSEEEKRQEVEATMQTLSMGEPISSLLEHGLTEEILERLIGAGIGTVERLGGMTPEELTAISGMDEEAVEVIQAAVNGFYGPYEGVPEEAETAPVLAEAIEPAPVEEPAAPAPAAEDVRMPGAPVAEDDPRVQEMEAAGEAVDAAEVDDELSEDVELAMGSEVGEDVEPEADEAGQDAADLGGEKPQQDDPDQKESGTINDA